ncbi:MAG: response regulator [Lachnospiraceae bacterium]|nr:response regulator [Lachnospiraceae bacterium]
MKEMVAGFKDKYFSDSLSPEVRIYNGMNLIVVCGLLLSTVLIRLFFPTVRAFLVTYAAAATALYTVYIGNSTHKYEFHAIIMSCVLNFIFFPTIYFEYGKLYFCIPVYFIIGLMYNVFLLKRKTAVLITLTDIVAYVSVLFAGELYHDINNDIAAESIKDYLAVYVGICIIAMCGGAAVRYRIHLHRLEEENLEKLHKEALDAYVNMDIFLVNMSHEIRTPMNAIIGTIGLLLDQDVNDHVKECVYNILNSSNALLSLTDEVMDLSKSGSQDIVLVNSRFDLSKLLMEIINMTSVRLMDSRIRFFVEIDGRLPQYAFGDGPRLRQVFINILNNAVKYTKEGRIILRVAGEAIDDNELMLRVEVEDTGVGIKSENIPHLFELYKRIDLTDDGLNAVEGTGLGLAICKEIIEKMSGEITVKSSYHVGSNFGFNVPIQEDSNERIVALTTPNIYSVLIYVGDDDECVALKRIFNELQVYSEVVNDKRSFETAVLNNKYSHIFVSAKHYYGDMRFLEHELTDEHLVIIANLNESISVNKIGFVMTRPIHIIGVAAVLMNRDSTYSREVVKKGDFTCPDATILVVDDNLTNLNVAGGILRKYGATVLTALSGKECLDILEKEHIDIIYLDYMMPEMNGIDTLECIRKMDGGAFADLPVVSLTANVINGAREMFLEAGFSDFISKPIDIDRIERSLKNLLPPELIQYKKQV